MENSSVANLGRDALHGVLSYPLAEMHTLLPAISQLAEQEHARAQRSSRQPWQPHAHGLVPQTLFPSVDLGSALVVTSASSCATGAAAVQHEASVGLDVRIMLHREFTKTGQLSLGYVPQKEKWSAFHMKIPISVFEKYSSHFNPSRGRLRSGYEESFLMVKVSAPKPDFSRHSTFLAAARAPPAMDSALRPSIEYTFLNIHTFQFCRDSVLALHWPIRSLNSISDTHSFIEALRT